MFIPHLFTFSNTLQAFDSFLKLKLLNTVSLICSAAGGSISTVSDQSSDSGTIIITEEGTVNETAVVVFFFRRPVILHLNVLPSNDEMNEDVILTL